MVQGRKIDDDGNILVKYVGGAVGVMTTSQAATGEGNNLILKVYGEKGAVKWSLLIPDCLTITNFVSGETTYRGFTSNHFNKVDKANYNKRLKNIKMLLKNKSGEFKGVVSEEKIHNLLAFSNIYSEAVRHIRSKKVKTNKITDSTFDYPTLADGKRGMRFIEKTVMSSQKKQWVKF